MKEYKTHWAKTSSKWPSFEDYIIIESLCNDKRLLIDINEFELLFSELLDNWKNGTSKYIQIVKEWNECIGFNNIQETPSIINDIDDTIEALKLIEGVEKEELFKITNKDLQLIISFLIENKNEELTIRKE